MKTLPKGMIVALATPFNPDESINFEAFKELVEYQIQNGMHGLLVGGSTGEYHTMSVEERKSIIKACCEHAAGRVPVMAGIGCPRPCDTIELGNYAAKCGAVWGLVVPPYYHQTSRQGIIDYYKEVAANTKVGVVIYNYPSATCVDLDAEMIRELAQEDNIVALKDTADMEHTCRAIAATRDLEFSVLQGFEHLMIPCFALGGAGAFGIIHNIVPKEIVALYETFMAGDWRKAYEINASLIDLYEYSEKEPYPGPVKAGLDALGMYGGVLRKPLTQTSPEMRENIKTELKKLGYAVK